MNELADLLLAAGALAACGYCFVLSRRLRRFTDLENGVGGAVAVLAGQVDDLSRTFAGAQSATRTSAVALGEVCDRAEAAGRRIELLLAAMHDLPDPQAVSMPKIPVFHRHPDSLRRSA
jgi:hypothetical protein